MRTIISDIEKRLRNNVLSLESIQGGDICESYKLTCANGQVYFLKTHFGRYSKDMFEAEALSLRTIALSGLATPEVISLGDNYLMLSWVQEGTFTPSMWQHFAKKLSRLHSVKNDKYGFQLDGYIGLIKQSNSWDNDFYSFYLQKRIEPLISRCYQKGLLSKTEVDYFDQISIRLESLIPSESPVLIHGDLWAGNYIASSSHEVFLIDAASAYNHRGFDLGMMKLFGGFHESFFNAYENLLPVSKDLYDSIGLFQLYYLLIHLELFGGVYFESVNRTLRAYK